MGIIVDIIQSDIFIRFVVIPLFVYGLYTVGAAVIDSVQRKLKEREWSGDTEIALYVIATILSCFCLLCCAIAGLESASPSEDVQEVDSFALESRYYEGYESGYSEGCREGYGTGYSDAEYKYSDLIIDAQDYARDITGWSVYEAYSNICIYHDGYDPSGYPLPTWQEYRESIDTLVYFSQFLEDVHFCN